MIPGQSDSVADVFFDDNSGPRQKQGGNVLPRYKHNFLLRF